MKIIMAKIENKNNKIKRLVESINNNKSNNNRTYRSRYYSPESIV